MVAPLTEGIHVTEADRVGLTLAVRMTRQEMAMRFSRLLEPIGLPNHQPKEVADYHEQLTELLDAINAIPTDAGALDGRFAPLLRQVVASYRRKVATAADERRQGTTHSELLGLSEKDVAPDDSLTRAAWFRDGEAATAPQASHYVHLAAVEEYDVRELRIPKRKARTEDEKFHILEAPSLFLPDLDDARRLGEMRGVTVAVAFLDIDHFKQVNTDLRGEPVTDVVVLPAFMRALEAHVYRLGAVYRFGGDEYAHLAAQHDASGRARVDERAASELASLHYEGLGRPVTVSVGVAIVPPFCHLTGHEIYRRANEAKTVAKGAEGDADRRNRVATYADPWFEKAEIVPREDPAADTQT